MFQTEPVIDTSSASSTSISDIVSEIKEWSLNDAISELAHKFVNFAIDVLIAIIVFYVGRFIIKRIYRLVGVIMVRRDVDKSLTTFVLSFIKIVLYFILIVTVIGIIGIETSSFLAIFASAGVAIGMALSGTLQNFAGGVLILLLKPYKIGDYIEAQGYAGTVREIQIFHTIIGTPDNKSIIIPNGGLSTSSINNWSRESYRRVQWDVAISYGDSVDVARKAILDMFATDHRVVKDFIDSDGDPDNSCPEGTKPDSNGTCVEIKPQKRSLLARIFRRPSKVKEAIVKWDESRESKIKELKPRVRRAPTVLVTALGDSSVNLSVRAWVRTKEYWDVFYEYNERIYSELPGYGIHFPFPQMDVHLKQQ